MVKTYKILLCGFSKSGKTALIGSVINSSFVNEYYPTIEDTYNIIVETDRHTKEKIRIFEIGGNQINYVPNNSVIEKHFISVIDSVIITYDLSNPNESFKATELLRKDIEKNRDRREISIFIICTKKDLFNDKIENDQIYKWASKEKIRIFETSLNDRKSIIDAFVCIASRISQPQMKSGFPFVKKEQK